MQKMHNYLPYSKHVILKNSGHMLNLENPEQFNDELLEFLKENACTQVQGYLYHSPAAAPSIEETLKSKAYQ